MSQIGPKKSLRREDGMPAWYMDKNYMIFDSTEKQNDLRKTYLKEKASMLRKIITSANYEKLPNPFADINDNLLQLAVSHFDDRYLLDPRYLDSLRKSQGVNFSSYQRLEFLGDAIANFALVSYIWHIDAPIDIIYQMQNWIISNRYFDRVMRIIGGCLPEEVPEICSDHFEALIGALYLHATDKKLKSPVSSIKTWMLNTFSYDKDIESFLEKNGFLAIPSRKGEWSDYRTANIGRGKQYLVRFCNNPTPFPVDKEHDCEKDALKTRFTIYSY